MNSVGTFLMMDNISDICSKVIPIQYPKVGTTNSAIKAGVINLSTNKTTWFEFEYDSRNYYVPRMQWAGDSQQVSIQHFNRRQNKVTLYLGDAKTGDLKKIFQEKDDTWIDLNDIHWINGGKSFTWLSESDGWRRLYLHARNEKTLKALTPEKQDAFKITDINVKTGFAYYVASPHSSTQRYLYKIKLDGCETASRVSPQDQPGTHYYDISPNQEWAIHKYSNIQAPGFIETVSLKQHESLRINVSNKKLKKKLTQLSKTETSFFKLKLKDKTELDGLLIKPPNFDPKKKYPILFYVYAEPWGTTVEDKWGKKRLLWHLFVAQQGYLEASADNRGTPSPKGRAWRKSIYGKLGTLTSADQAEAAQQIIAWDFVDQERVAIWGRSGGKLCI